MWIHSGTYEPKVTCPRLVRFRFGHLHELTGMETDREVEAMVLLAFLRAMGPQPRRSILTVDNTVKGATRSVVLANRPPFHLDSIGSEGRQSVVVLP